MKESEPKPNIGKQINVISKLIKNILKRGGGYKGGFEG